MTISSTIRRAGPYQGTGTVDTFPFSFRVLQAQDLRVIQANELGIETDLIFNTDYTVTQNPDQETTPGGNIILSSPLPVVQTITITSNADYIQPTKLTNQGGFYPTVINDALDRLTIFVQQIYEQVGRSVKVKISSDIDPDVLIESLTDAVPRAEDAANRAETASAAAEAAAAALEDGLQDLASVKEDVEDLKEAVVPATDEEIRNGAPGKLVDAAGLKNTIATQEDIEAGEAVKLVDAAGLKAHEQSKNAILYPNGGSEASPANITANSYYTMDNPFPGKRVRCTAELLYSGKWGQMPNGSSTYVTTGGAGLYGGLNVGLVDGAIVLRTAQHHLLISAYIDTNVWNVPSNITVATLPCRVVVECIEV